MKVGLLLFLSLIFPTFATKGWLRKMLNPRYCVNCKFVILDADNPEYSTCSLFPRNSRNNRFLVTGQVDTKKDDYSYCSTARNSDHGMCGKLGIFYQRKEDEYDQGIKDVKEEVL